ncbi:MAG: hypothetical protein ACYSU6_08050 [Planctomycetota bacterium]|jgi:hypothetical protein
MKRLVKTLLAVTLVLCFSSGSVFAQPADDSATCDITVTVDPIMEWSAASYGPIALANITSVTDTPSGTADFTLYTNCNSEISADNTATAQLSSATDTLVTEYQLAFDGDGASATGGTDVGSWTDYTTFLSTASAVTHVDGDGTAVITLSAQASTGGSAPDSGAYSATQTLTVSWTSN